MPLRLIAGRKKTQSQNYYIRGSYLGVGVDRSCRTNRRHVALAQLKELERQIERGEYPPKEAPRSDSEQLTFITAALNYMRAGKSPRYVSALIAYFGTTPITEIDQIAIDNAAVTLRPNVTNATRNTCVYTPVSAILHHNGHVIVVKRPKGAKGNRRTIWLPPADAFGIIAAADVIDAELATLLVSLLYTGPRISAALDVARHDILLDEGTQWARPQKGQQPHAIKLKKELRDRFTALLASHERERVFRWRYGGHLKFLLIRAKLAYLGIACPTRRPNKWREPPNRLKGVTFHTFRHTFGTWMRRYGKATIDDMLDLGNWHDRRAAESYIHAAPDGVWDRVELLPDMPEAIKIGKNTGKQ